MFEEILQAFSAELCDGLAGFAQLEFKPHLMFVHLFCHAWLWSGAIGSIGTNN